MKKAYDPTKRRWWHEYMRTLSSRERVAIAGFMEKLARGNAQPDTWTISQFDYTCITRYLDTCFAHTPVHEVQEHTDIAMIRQALDLAKLS